uniref:procollagen-proline 4-dioxygenase n=1 Tax=Scleropages formosus TaxID=113540 RepID=A0A8C9VNM1_SCLFO
MTLSFLVLAMTLCILPGGVRAEIYTSIGQMTDLIFRERELVQSLKEYIQTEKSRLAFVKSWAGKLDALTQLSTSDPEGYLAHPVNAYKLLKRLNMEWSELENLVLQDVSNGFLANILLHKQFFPDEEDKIGAAKALMRLQDTYKLDSEILSSGKLPGVRHNGFLTVDDCFDMGKIAYDEEDHYHSALWMQEVLRRLDAGEDGAVSLSEALDYLSFSVYQLGDLHRSAELIRRLPSHQRALGNLNHLEMMMSKKIEDGEEMHPSPATERPVTLETYERPRDHLPERETYEALCRGEGVRMTEQRRSRLFCRYQDRGRNPRLLLAPMKEEDEWDNPHIVRYLDALSQTEMDRIKELAKPVLARATVRDPVSGVLTVANYRVSKSAWLGDEVDPIIARVSQRIEDVTGLSLETAESLQVANYGVGGQYEPHFDFSRKDEPDAIKSLGNAQLTLFCFLLQKMSDVEAGGATVFTDIGAAIWPRKGTAVFWYNLWRSGEGDYRTRHAACPVLVGSKWVANKWIHERGQEFLRQCGLTEVD